MTGSQDDSHALTNQRQAKKVCPGQFEFDWEQHGASKADTPSEADELFAEESEQCSAPEPAPPPVAATSPQLGSKSPALLARKYPFREVVERYLRENGVPYINVDEAKRALFGGQKLRTFHFVVYRTPQKNWLLHTAQMRKELREDLKQWVEIFGDGFIGVIAKQKPDGTPKFQTMNGDPIEIK